MTPHDPHHVYRVDLSSEGKCSPASVIEKNVTKMIEKANVETILNSQMWKQFSQVELVIRMKID